MFIDYYIVMAERTQLKDSQLQLLLLDAAFL